MKKSIILIIVILIIVMAVGAVIFLRGNKPCSELNEQECKKAKDCVSVLVPCTSADCTSEAIFKECKDK